METLIRYNFTSDKYMNMDDVFQICVKRFNKEKKLPFIGGFECLIIGINGNRHYEYSVSLILLNSVC